MKRRKVAAVFTGRETFIIPTAKAQKSRPNREGFPLSMPDCWSGIANGLRRPSEISRRQIRFYKRAVPASIFGQTNMRTNMSTGCETTGNEPHLLGHKSIHLSLRRLGKILDSGRST